MQITGYRLQEDAGETLSAVSNFSLASNQHVFWIAEPNAVQENLTLGTTSSSNGNSSWEKEALIGVGIVAAAAGGYGVWRSCFSAEVERLLLQDERLGGESAAAEGLENEHLMEAGNDEGHLARDARARLDQQEQEIAASRSNVLEARKKQASVFRVLIDYHLTALLEKRAALLRNYYISEAEQLPDGAIKNFLSSMKNFTNEGNIFKVCSSSSLPFQIFNHWWKIGRGFLI